MAAAVEVRKGSAVTLFGKDVYLSPASIFVVANGSATVRIDSSALDSLSNNNPPPPYLSAKFKFSLLNDLTLEEAKASLLLALNNLLVSGVCSRLCIRRSLLTLLTHALNTPPSETLDFNSDLISKALKNPSSKTLDFESGSVTAIIDGDILVNDDGLIYLTPGELLVLEEPLYIIGAISGIIDHQAMPFSTLADALAALSCEASAVNQIPEIHDSLRESSRLVHSTTRTVLNSPVCKYGKDRVTALVGTSLCFAFTICKLGTNSLSRAQLNIDAIIGNTGLKSSLTGLLDRECPKANALKELFKSLSQANVDEDYVNFFHQLNSLFETAREIVSWEAVTAFVAIEEGQTVDKKVLGRGSSLLLQFIKDKLQCDSSALLEKLGQPLLAILDTKHPSFSDLLSKIKVVESNESRRLPKLPKGTRDFTGEQMVTREKAFSISTDVFKRHGATALDTPAFELRETLMGKYGEDSKLIYDLEDQGGELCSLRYDLTVPFARYVATNGITSLKSYQIGKVYRRDNPSKGRFREFYQCDFDIAGQHVSMGPDFEVVKVLTELLDELEIGDYEIKLNHHKLLDGIMEICGVPPDKFRTICSSIDKLDKLPFEVIKTEMVEEKGLTVETADTIGNFIRQRGSPLEVLSKLKQDLKGNKDSSIVVALDELGILFEALKSSKCIDKVVLDLSLARGLDYYTGVIFEAVFRGATQVGSIAAGGRYDNLIGMFGSKQVPAVGVSLGIERVVVIMEQLQKEPIRATETQVLVGVLGGGLSLAAELVSELWDARIKADYMVNKRPMKHIQRAKAARIPWLVIVGDREFQDKVVKLKDVEAAKEETVSRKTFVKELRRRLSSASP